MPKVTFAKEKITVDVPEGTNLRKAARKAGVEVYGGLHKFVHCPGLGMCGSCRMLVKDGKENLSEPGMIEKFTTRIANPEAQFAYIGNEDELRLSCQCKINGDVTVESQAPCNWHGEKFWG